MGSKVLKQLKLKYKRNSHWWKPLLGVVSWNCIDFLSKYNFLKIVHLITYMNKLFGIKTSKQSIKRNSTRFISDFWELQYYYPEKGPKANRWIKSGESPRKPFWLVYIKKAFQSIKQFFWTQTAWRSLTCISILYIFT